MCSVVVSTHQTVWPSLWSCRKCALHSLYSSHLHLSVLSWCSRSWCYPPFLWKWVFFLSEAKNDHVQQKVWASSAITSLQWCSCTVFDVKENLAKNLKRAVLCHFAVGKLSPVSFLACLSFPTAHRQRDILVFSSAATANARPTDDGNLNCSLSSLLHFRRGQLNSRLSTVPECDKHYRHNADDGLRRSIVDE